MNNINAGTSQQQLEARFNTNRVADVHCHCLPGVDDGPASLEASLDLCRRLVDDGITDVVATPHQLGRYDRRNEAPAVRAAVADLNATLERQEIPLRIHPGADVRIDERMPELLQDDRILSVADGGRYILLELPHETYIEPGRVIQRLVAAGVTPIVTHPERHEHLQKHPALALPWLQMGAILQITAGSLVGRFGPAAQRVGLEWVTRGQASIVASDAHDTEARPPRFVEAIDALLRVIPHPIVRRVFIENPVRVLEGKAVVGLSRIGGGVPV